MEADGAATSRCGRGVASPAVRIWLACLALLLIAAVPILINRHPPLVDYPWHVARVVALAQWRESPFVQEHFQLSSPVVPNLGLEIIVLPLLQVLPLVAAMDVFLITCFTLILSGTVALHRVLHGSWSWWPLVAAVFLYNWILLYGFLGYILGIGLLLCATAAWLALRDHPWWLRLLVGSAFSILLFFVHMITLGLYAVAVAGYELQRAVMGPGRGEARLAGLAVGAGQFVLPFILFLIASPTRVVVGGGWQYKLFEKFASPLATLTIGHFGTDLATLVGLATATGIVLRYARVRIASQFGLALALLVVAFLALPHAMNWVGLVDVRVPAALLFVFIAALRIEFRSRRAAWALAVVLAGIFIARVGLSAVQWAQFDEVADAYRTALAAMKPASSLFVAERSLPQSWAQRMYVDRVRYPKHGALAVLEQPVFYSSGFIERGQQPIEVRERFRPLKDYQQEGSIKVADERELRQVIAHLADLQRAAAPSEGAYLLLVDRDLPPLRLPEGIGVVAGGPGFRLLQVYDPGGRSEEARRARHEVP
jgi:hypothetical protein